MALLLFSYHFTKKFQRVSLLSMNEDQWVRTLSRQTEKHAQWLKGLGIGDDAAFFRPRRGFELVICSDSLVEGVHFLYPGFSARDLGWKSLAVNLSDLASMGARPKGSLLNISLPPKEMGRWAKDFLKGYLSLSEKHQVGLIGGDTTTSLESIFISVTVFGEIQKKNLKLRSTAKPGDLVCVTGVLGDSRAGLYLQTHEWESPHRRKLLRKHHRPTPRVEMGQWLAKQPAVTSMMDISDGLMKDLSRLCQASRVSARLDHKRIPLSPSLRAFAERFKRSAVREAVIGGEDYELLFTCKPDQKDFLATKFQKQFGSRLFIIGKLEKFTKKPELNWVDSGFAREASLIRSFEHF